MKENDRQIFEGPTHYQLLYTQLTHFVEIISWQLIQHKFHFQHEFFSVIHLKFIYVSVRHFHKSPKVNKIGKGLHLQNFNDRSPLWFVKNRTIFYRRANGTYGRVE